MSFLLPIHFRLSRREQRVAMRLSHLSTFAISCLRLATPSVVRAHSNEGLRVRGLTGEAGSSAIQRRAPDKTIPLVIDNLVRRLFQQRCLLDSCATERNLSTQHHSGNSGPVAELGARFQWWHHLG